jgi:hypothetical protein
MMQNEQDEDFQQNMQLINEVPQEEEEGESQDVAQSRRLQSNYANMHSNQLNDEAAFAPDAEQNLQREDYAEQNPERV